MVLVGLELWGEAVEVAREQGDFADVGGYGEVGDPSFESDGETAVGWGRVGRPDGNGVHFVQRPSRPPSRTSTARP